MSGGVLSIIQNPNRPWLYQLKFGYNPDLIKIIKDQRNGVTYPGVTWDGTKKIWSVPEEHLTHVMQGAKQLGLIPRMQGSIDLPASWDSAAMNPRLKSYQREGALQALKHHRFILNFPMGTGKTLSALEWLRLLGLERKILVVCPAMARRTWEKESEKWLSLGLRRLDTGKKVAAAEEAPGITVTSYGLVGELQTTKWDSIVFDESHYLAYSSSQRSKDSSELVKQNPAAKVLALTGTPITNNVESLWNQVDTLWPGRMGSRMYADGPRTPRIYKVRYMNELVGYQGHPVYKGLHPDTAAELQARLSAFSMRITKEEIAHLLPQLGPPTVVEGEGIVEYLQKCVVPSNKFTCVLTMLRKTAREIVEKLEGAVPTYEITGALTPEQRHNMLDEAKTRDGAVVVATLDSVRESIDLTFCNTVCYAELPNTPIQLIQSLGRFHRLSGTHNVGVIFAACESDWMRAEELAARVNVVNQLIKPSTEEIVGESALDSLKNKFKVTDEDLAAFLSEASATMGVGI